ncbi:type IV pilin protein [Massilia sp. YIM B02763]|uniref:type IV pilin protein n=1 Tax=Massilia sp. YIM B02763 TaxID=3050130 RepID=UPI0025B64B2A|nr:type IV pilin protein [Massilia sp. YIM B02763]MDN4051512.1 type IV pilin protein [Massilia sp. YIM B02763]
MFMNFTTPSPRRARGFTLIELLIVVAIVGILSAIAVPQYRDYVIRARLTEAFTGLGSVQTAAEEFWNNNHTYEHLDQGTPSRMPSAENFDFTLVSASDSAFVVKATGKNQMVGFSYTIDQNGNRKTLGTFNANAWGTSDSCWIDRKGSTCVQ